ncbi:MAG TPA: hypothetical protein VH912_12645 [Streptosporangiaceae bacterium]|jgi:hypothetical protein
MDEPRKPDDQPGAQHDRRGHPYDRPGHPYDRPGEPYEETYNPWSIVNLVFHHLAEQGLRPVLGSAGDPGGPAAELLKALGIKPAAEGNRQLSQDVDHHLARLRDAVFGDE